MYCPQFREVNLLDKPAMKNSNDSTETQNQNQHPSPPDKVSRIKHPADAEYGEYKRTAEICRDSSGHPKGVALWINADELEAIGINTIETAKIAINFVEDEIHLKSLDRITC